MNDETAVELDGIRGDQQRERAISALQQRTFARLTGLIDELAAELAAKQPAHEMDLPTDDVFILGRRSRQRQEKAVTLRREAEDLIFASLHNLDNPGWDPGNPDTYANNDGCLLQQVLQWRP
jgi:hypothetical protein